MAGNKGYRPNARLRKGNQYGGFERAAAVGEQGFGNFFNAGVDGFDDGNPTQKAVPCAENPSAQYVGGEYTGNEQDDCGGDDAQAGNVEPPEMLGLPAFR